MYESMADNSLLSLGNSTQDCIVSNLTQVPLASMYTTMLSSLASMIGSSLIILTFVIWPDLRSVARAILVFLAIADLLSAIGYIFASIVFLVQRYHDSDVSHWMCTFQSFVTTTFPISSFIWTANLAVYLFVAITLRKAKLAKKLVLLFHITGWGIPLLLCIPGAAFGVLGNTGATQGTVAWCWVSFDDHYDENSTLPDATQRLNLLHVEELIYGKFWEISISILAVVLCSIVKWSLHRKKKESQAQSARYGSLTTEKAQAAIVQLDQKLIWIPIVFILFRFWGTLRWLIASLDPNCLYIDPSCSSAHGHIWFTEKCVDVLYNKGLVYLQSIGDTGQGWANALLYVIFHATIARRLCPCVFIYYKRLKNAFQGRLKNKDYSQIEHHSEIGHSEHDQVALSVSKSSLIESETIPSHRKDPLRGNIISPDAVSINALES